MSAIAGPILALDTATATAVVALGEPDGRPIAAVAWPGGHRHGEELIDRIAEVLRAAGCSRAELGGIVAGTGPGAFTGLRVGLATAKGLAHGLGLPIAGVATSRALLVAAREATGDALGRSFALLLPAGPADRVFVADGAGPVRLPAGEEPAVAAGTVLVAVDLEDRAPSDALAIGRDAVAGLGDALLRLGAAALAAGPGSIAELVPEYVTLPRGVRELSGSVQWSLDPR
jgi:tRNA threonylcarbamoyl adenosine modification protein YeaZ